MNFRGVAFLLGRLLLALTLALLVPTGLAWWENDPSLHAFALSVVVVGVVGLVVQWLFRPREEFRFSRREAFVLVTGAWFMASFVGAFPYLLFHGPEFIVDALFESTAGFTTTGASILTDIEAQPRALLLWRSLSQWLGGMGIIVLGIAILPKLAVGGMDLLGAEAPGPITEKLTPRIAQTAKALWGIYVLLTALAGLALMALGVGLFDAVNHAFTTMAIGGFSTKNASIAAFDSAAVDAVVTFFLLVAGANFALHFQLLRGRPLLLLRDPEFRFYIGLYAVATLVVTTDLWVKGVYLAPLNALRYASFQVGTILTTTGYATANYDAWPPLSKALLFLLLFVGGCSGSTAGSVKCVRIIILTKKLAADLKRLASPHAVVPVRLGRRAIPDDVVSTVVTFFTLYLTLFALGGLALAALGSDLITAFSASASAIGNVGPGLGAVGPASNYAALPWASKLILTVLMIAGRLEIYPLLVIMFLSRRRPGL